MQLKDFKPRIATHPELCKRTLVNFNISEIGLCPYVSIFETERLVITPFFNTSTDDAVLRIGYFDDDKRFLG